MSFTAKLSVLDQAKPVMHQSIYMCFPSEDAVKTGELIRQGIEKTIHQLPYLRGVIFRGDDQGYSVLNWTDTSPVHVEHKIVPGLPTYMELQRRGMPLHRLQHDLRPTGAVGNHQPNAKLPAFLSSFTTLDGGIILSLSFHHHFVDGLGIGTILELIADNTAGREPRVKHDPLNIFERFHDVNKALGYGNKSWFKSGGTLGVVFIIIAGIAQALQGLMMVVAIIALVGLSYLARRLWERRLNLFVRASASQTSTTSKTPTKPTLNPNLEPRMITFSVQALEGLRKSFVQQFRVQAPSMVGLITGLLWVSISSVRSGKAVNCNKKGPTTLFLALNSRVAFAKSSYFNSDHFIGNFSTAAPATQPLRRVAGDALTTAAPTMTNIATSLARPLRALAGSAKSASKRSTIKQSYKPIFDTPDARALAMANFQLPPSPIMLTSYANFPWYFDFGPGVGKVECGRFATAAGEGFDGAVALLPRNRELKGKDEVIEVFVKLNREDIKAFEQHPWLTPFFARAPF